MSDDEDPAIIREGVIRQAEREIADILRRVEAHCAGELVSSIDVDNSGTMTTVILGMEPLR